jgi:hypothetical protein
MTPNVGLDMTELLVGFCSLAVGFVFVGLAALVAFAIDEGPLRKRRLSRLARTMTSERPECPVERTVERTNVAA